MARGRPARRPPWLTVVALTVGCAAVAAAAECPEYCRLQVAPVCGSDGVPYQSACIAACAGAAVEYEGPCRDGKAAGLRFYAPRRSSRKERAAAVSRDVMLAYLDSGFSYLGRVKLADAPGLPRSWALQRPAWRAGGGAGGGGSAGAGAAEAGRRAKQGGALRLESGRARSGGGGDSSGGGSGGGGGTSMQHALRFTPAGDLYYARLPGNASASSVLQLLPSLPEGTAEWAQRLHSDGSGSGLGRRRGSSSSSSSSSSESSSSGSRDSGTSGSGSSRNGSAQAPGRALKMIIGRDDRGRCGQPPQYPFTAVGQLDFVTQNMDYICSGALVRRDKVLTAAHCVFSAAERTFVHGVGFAAGRYRSGGGAVVSPFGVQAWKHVTLVSDVPAFGPPVTDLAVVTLTSEVSPEAGTMGVEAGCPSPDDGTAKPLRTAGYASDRSSGECVTEVCVVAIGCGAEATPHTCDTYMGQSGSPFWDARQMVRGVHVRGMPTVNEFSNINAATLRSILAS